MNKRCVIGVDLGGTNVRASAFYHDGSSAGRSFTNPSNAQSGTSEILASVIEAVSKAIAGAETPPDAVGLAIPGHVDDSEGIVRWAPNFGETVDGVFRHWQNVAVRKPLEEALGLPIRMGNDANLAALGEYRFGVGRDSAKCLVLLTLGTGIGGGVVMAPTSLQGDARGPLVLVGGNKGGAELGHIVVNYQGPECTAGEYGSLESYLQRDALVKRAQNRILRGRKSVLSDLVGGNLADLTPKNLTEACDQGDEVALEVFEEAGVMLGVGIGNAINIFAPDIVAIGGQVANARDYLLKPAIKSARNVGIPTLFSDAKIMIAEQIADSGMMGAAAFAFQ